MVIILGRAVIRDGNLTEALRLSLEHVARSRLEPGCLEHGVSQAADRPNELVFVEKWADMAAVKAHFAVPASREFAKALGAMSEGAPAIELLSADKLPFG